MPFFEVSNLELSLQKIEKSFILILPHLGKPQEALYIGDTFYDSECATNAGVNFGVAIWGCSSVEQIHATYYFEIPKEVLSVLLK